MALLNYPMFVVTTQANGSTAGCLVGFACQASIRPPRFLVGLSAQNHTFRVAANATHLAVHVFDIEHIDIVELFGSQTGDGPTNSTGAGGIAAQHGCPSSTMRPLGS